MKSQIKYKNSTDFGKDLGFSLFEIELIRQKKALVEKLKNARKAKGISQANLAKMIFTQQPAIARMESGQIGEISLDFLCKIALALNVSVTIKAKVA